MYFNEIIETDGLYRAIAKVTDCLRGLVESDILDSNSHLTFVW